MTLIIDLAPEMETRLHEIAARQGQDPTSFVKAAVEEKLQRVAMEDKGTQGNGIGTKGTTNGDGTNGDGTVQRLDQMLAGLTGAIHSQDGRGGGRLSETSGADFGEDLVQKQRRGEL